MLNDHQWTESLDRLKSATQLRTLEGRSREYLVQRAAELQTRERALERREGRLREAWMWFRVAVVLFGVAILIVFAAAPVFLQWADQYWRQGR